MLRIARTKLTGSLVDFSVKRAQTKYLTYFGHRKINVKLKET